MALATLVCLACVDLTRPTGLSSVPAIGARDGATDQGADTPQSLEVGRPETAPLDERPAPDRPAELSSDDADPDGAVDLTPDDAALAPLGATCTAADGCASGFCVDGVCCENICNSACYVCALSASRGLCRAVPAGEDPGNECTSAQPTTCGLDGTCNGMGACRLHVAGTTCRASTCTGSNETASGQCNGTGTCVSGATRDCSPYLCGSGACRSSCSTTADCKAGFTCNGSTCATPPADAGAPDPGVPGALTIDDFADGTLLRNTMGGAVTWDNQNVALVAGQLRFTWDGSGGFNDFIETFLPNFCPYDIRGYRTLRFRMRATANRAVRILYSRGDTSCNTLASPVLTTINLGTTMQSYDVDVTSAMRDRALFFEWSPNSLDATEYFLDDIQLLP